jgi:hypothetical protein
MIAVSLAVAAAVSGQISGVSGLRSRGSWPNSWSKALLVINCKESVDAWVEVVKMAGQFFTAPHKTLTSASLILLQPIRPLYSEAQTTWNMWNSHHIAMQ